jgi:hypothetical protein
MTVIERLYDNAWYVANAAPSARATLDADCTRAWMVKEAAVEHLSRVLTVAGISPGRSALALSQVNAAVAAFDRARARAAEAKRCTDIVGGHAFAVTRTPSSTAGMTVEISSCTLLRRVTLTVSAKGEQWRGDFVDPQGRRDDRVLRMLSTDPWESFHFACEWITTGQF